MSGSAVGGPAGVVVRDRTGQRIATVTAGSVLRWCTVVGSMALVVAQVVAAAPGRAWWPGILVLVLALVSAELADTGVPLLTLAVAVGWWIVVVPDPTAGPTVAVAVAVAAFHLATAHAAVGPPGRSTTGAVVRSALLRGALVCSTALVLGALAAVVGRVVVPAAGVLALLGVAVLARFTTR